MLGAFGFEPVPGRPGLYRSAPGWRVEIVVISALPRTRDTLVLRLLGTRSVRRDAIRELAALPDDAWERSVSLPWLARLHVETPAEPSARAAGDAEEEEIATEVPQLFERLKQSIRGAGRNEEQIRKGQEPRKSKL